MSGFYIVEIQAILEFFKIFQIADKHFLITVHWNSQKFVKIFISHRGVEFLEVYTVQVFYFAKKKKPENHVLKFWSIPGHFTSKNNLQMIELVEKYQNRRNMKFK